MTIKESDAFRSDIISALNSARGQLARIQIRTGANSGAGGQGTLLAEMTGNASGWGVVSNGVLTSNPITGDVSADATGIAGHYQINTTAGVFLESGLLDGSDGININDLFILVGSQVDFSGEWVSTSAYDLNIDEILRASNDDLLVFYTMDAVSANNLIDLSKQSQNGLISGASQFNGVIDKALLFNSPTDIVTTPVTLPATGDWSASFWLRTTQSTDAAIFSNNNGQGGRASIGLSSGLVRVFSAGGVNFVLDSNTQIDSGYWVHVAVSRESLNYTIFINGQSDKTGSNSNSIDSTGFSLGRNPAGSQPFDGELDQFRVFDKAVTQQEVASLYNEGSYYKRLILSDSPTAYWTFDDISGSVIVDSANNYNGTYGNSPALNQAPVVKTGTSVTMDGSLNYGVVPHDADLNPRTSEYAIEFWMGFTTANATTGGVPFGNFNLTVPYVGPIVFVNYLSYSAGSPVGRISFREQRSDFTSGYELDLNITGANDGVIRHYVFQRKLVSTSPDVWRLQAYVNGILDNEITLPSVLDLNPTGLFCILSRQGSQQVGGTFDEMAYYVGKSLTEAQILNHYAVGSGS